MAERSVAVRIAVKDVEQARRRLLSLGADGQKALQQIERGASPARRALLGIESSITRVDRSITSLRRSAGFLAGGLGAVTAALSVRQVLDAAISYERLENTLRAATGSAAAAADDLIFLRAEAERLGLNFETLATQFAKFSAAARGTALEGIQTREIFGAISETSRVLGLRVEQVEGALRAFEQIISKGTVQAEELRGQLGERLPGAFQIAARSIGVTTAELDHMLKAGELASEELLPAFARELRKTFGPEVERAAGSAQAQIERFNNALFQLKVEFARSGALDAFVTGLNAIKDVISSPDFRAGMVEFGQWVEDSIRYLVEHGSEIASAAGALGGAVAGARVGGLLGPTGRVAGAVVGGAAGFLLSSDRELISERERTIETLEQQQQRILASLELDPTVLREIPEEVLRAASMEALVRQGQAVIDDLEQLNEDRKRVLSEFSAEGREGEIVAAFREIVDEATAFGPALREAAEGAQAVLGQLTSVPPRQAQDAITNYISELEASIAAIRQQADDATQALRDYVPLGDQERQERRLALEEVQARQQEAIAKLEEQRETAVGLLSSFDIITPTVRRSVLAGHAEANAVSLAEIEQQLEAYTQLQQGFAAETEEAAGRTPTSILDQVADFNQRSIERMQVQLADYASLAADFATATPELQQDILAGVVTGLDRSIVEIELKLSEFSRIIDDIAGDVPSEQVSVLRGFIRGLENDLATAYRQKEAWNAVLAEFDTEPPAVREDLFDDLLGTFRRAIEAIQGHQANFRTALEGFSAAGAEIELPDPPDLSGVAQEALQRLRDLTRLQTEALADDLDRSVDALEQKLREAEERLARFEVAALETLAQRSGQGLSEAALQGTLVQIDRRRSELEAEINQVAQQLTARTDEVTRLREELEKLDPAIEAVREQRELDRQAAEAEAAAAKKLADQQARQGSLLGALAKQLEEEAKAQRELSELRAKTVADLEREVEELERLAEAEEQGAERAREVALQIEIENQLRELQIDLNTKLGQSIAELITIRDKETRSIEASQEARQRDAEAVARAEREARRKREQLEEEARRLAVAPFENALENIQSLMTDTFEKIYRNGIDSFGDLADAVKDIWFRLMAELTTLSIIRPQLVFGAGGILNGLVGTGAVGGGGAGLAFQGTSSFLGTAGAAGSAAGGAAQLAQLGGLTSAITSLSSVINNFGFNTLGAFGSPTFGAGALTSASLTSVLGAGGLGFLGGGTLANILGLGQTGGSIGGGVGAALGISVGPLGAAIGAAAGSVIGGAIEKLIGAFGGDRKPEVRVQTGTREPFQTSGGVPITREGPFGTVGLADIGTRGVSGELVASVSDFIASFDEDIASVLSRRQIEVASEILQRAEREPVQFRKFNLGEEGFKLLRPRAEDILRAIAPQADVSRVFEGIDVEVDSDSGENIQALVDRLKQAAETIRLFNELTGIEEPETELIRQLNLLREQFDSVRGSAAALGLEVEKLDQAQVEAEKKLEKGLREELRAIAQGGLDGLSELEVAITSLQQRLKELKTEAKALGIDPDIVTEPARKGLKNLERALRENLRALARGEEEAGEFTQAVQALQLRFEQARREAELLGVKTDIVAVPEQRALKRIEGDLRESLRNLARGTEETSRFAEELAKLEATFRDARQAAEELGLSGDIVAEPERKARQRLIDQFKDEVRALAGRPLPEFSQAVADLRSQIDAFKRDAKALGLSADIVSEPAAKALQNLRDDFLAELNDLAGSGLSGILQDLEDLIARFQTATEEAQALGVSVAEVRDIERRALINFKRDALDQLSATLKDRTGELVDFFERILEPLYDAQRDLTFGALSALSPQEQLRQAQAAFADIAQRAEQGNVAALEGLPEAASTLIEAAREFGASPEQARAFAQVSQVLDKVIEAQESLRDEFSVGIPELIDENRQNTRDMVEAMASGLENLRLEFVRTQRILEQRIGTVGRTA